MKTMSTTMGTFARASIIAASLLARKPSTPWCICAAACVAISESPPDSASFAFTWACSSRVTKPTTSSTSAENML